MFGTVMCLVLLILPFVLCVLMVDEGMSVVVNVMLSLMSVMPCATYRCAWW